jgi:hypothetical protein
MEHIVLIGEMFGLEKNSQNIINNICLPVPFRLLPTDTVLLVRYLCILLLFHYFTMHCSLFNTIGANKNANHFDAFCFVSELKLGKPTFEARGTLIEYAENMES